MAIRDDYITVLRNLLGAGFESEPLNVLLKEYAKRALKPHVLALRESRHDFSIMEGARDVAEQTLRAKDEALRTARDALKAQLDLDVGSF